MYKSASRVKVFIVVIFTAKHYGWGMNSSKVQVENMIEKA